MDSLESIRLEQFRQFQKEIRGSEQYLIVGLDIAKDQHHGNKGDVREGRGREEGQVYFLSMSSFSR